MPYTSPVGALVINSVESATHDHRGCMDRAINCAEKVCLERGVRFTRIRRRVLELIWKSHHAAKAYDLLDSLRLTEPSAKPATIYRALEFLLQNGLIHRIESLNAYIGCADAERPHEVLLLICEDCENVEERNSPVSMQAIVSELSAAGFQAQRTTLEVRGFCKQCVQQHVSSVA